jgi:hypothetical protein
MLSRLHNAAHAHCVEQTVREITEANVDQNHRIVHKVQLAVLLEILNERINHSAQCCNK